MISLIGPDSLSKRDGDADESERLLMEERNSKNCGQAAAMMFFGFTAEKSETAFESDTSKISVAPD